MGAFASKKSFISKLKNITTVTSVKTANLTRVRITMASPMQSEAKVYCLGRMYVRYQSPKYENRF